GHDDHAGDARAVAERHGEERLVHDVGPGDDLSVVAVARIADEVRLALLCRTAGDAVAEAAGQVLEPETAVLAAVASESDRPQLLALEDVDAAVVVVDELPQLVGHRGPDLRQLVEAVELPAEPLQHLQVGDRAQVALLRVAGLRPLDVELAEDEAAVAAAGLDGHHRG